MGDLIAEDIVVGYSTSGTVLNHFTLEVHAGEVVGLLGANGAGKTTTLRALSGLLAPRSGRVLLNGSDLTGRSPLQFVRAGLSHLPEGRGTLVDLTVEENLRVAAAVKKVPLKTVFDESFEYFPRLAERRSQLAGTLSGGEQQMLGVARALASRPSHLLLDEPSLGLAPVTAQLLFRTLKEILQDRKMAILVVEQNVNLCLDIADNIYVIENGHIVSSGTPDNIAQGDTVLKAFLGI